jgi:hypothetical protein
VEAQRFFGRELFVSDDYLEVIAVCIGDEQVQLNGTFRLLAVLAADKYKAVAVVPTRRLPVRFEKAALSIPAE